MPEASESERRTVLTVATMSSFLAPFMGSSVIVALPAIRADLGMGAVSQNWVLAAYVLTATIFLIPMGRLADIYGRKKVFQAGLIVYVAGSFASVFAMDELSFIVLRALQGFGGSMIFGTGVAILTSVYPANKRGKALGINTAAVYIGLSSGPLIGGLLTSSPMGWRSIFALNAALGVGIIAAVRLNLKSEWAGAKGERFDYIGSAVYGAAIFFLMYGCTHLSRSDGPVLLAGGVVLFVLFVLWELNERHPMIDIGLFRHNRVFAFSNLAALINYSAASVIGLLLSYYLQDIRGFTSSGAGMVLFFQPLTMAAASPFAGRLSDRVEPRIIASVGMGITAIALLLFTLITATTPIWMIIANAMLLGVGLGSFASPNTNAIMGSVDKRLYGVATSTVGTMRLTGSMVSNSIVLLAFSVYLGDIALTPEVSGDLLVILKALFMIFACICAAGIYFSFSRGNVGVRP